MCTHPRLRLSLRLGSDAGSVRIVLRSLWIGSPTRSLVGISPPPSPPLLPSSLSASAFPSLLFLLLFALPFPSALNYATRARAWAPASPIAYRFTFFSPAHSFIHSSIPQPYRLNLLLLSFRLGLIPSPPPTFLRIHSHPRTHARIPLGFPLLSVLPLFPLLTPAFPASSTAFLLPLLASAAC